MSGAVEIRRLDHVGIAVRDLQEACRLYVDVLGGRFVLGADNDDAGMRVVQLSLGGSKVELLSPLRDDSLLAASIARRGEGLHHVTFVVDDVLHTVDELATRGVATVGTDVGTPAWCETFVRPEEAGGALLQLVSTDRDWSEPVDGITLDDVLGGQAVFEGAIPRRRVGGA